MAVIVDCMDTLVHVPASNGFLLVDIVEQSVVLSPAIPAEGHMSVIVRCRSTATLALCLLVVERGIKCICLGLCIYFQ